MTDPQQFPPPPPMGKKEAKAQAAASKAYSKSQRNWFMRHKILTGLAALIVLIIVISASSSGGGKNEPAADDQVNTVTPTTGAKPPAAKPAGGTVLLTATGKGSKQTQKFTAAGDWDLAYSYDCANFGQAGNFQVFVYGGTGQLSLSNTGPNELEMKGNDVTHNHNGGTYYLQVNTVCAWTMKVTAV